MATLTSVSNSRTTAASLGPVKASSTTDDRVKEAFTDTMAFCSVQIHAVEEAAEGLLSAPMRALKSLCDELMGSFGMSMTMAMVRRDDKDRRQREEESRVDAADQARTSALAAARFGEDAMISQRKRNMAHTAA